MRQQNNLKCLKILIYTLLNIYFLVYLFEILSLNTMKQLSMNTHGPLLGNIISQLNLMFN